MARQEGFEPPTIGFVVRYSIQLSYWRNHDEKALYPEKRLSTSGFCLLERLGDSLPHSLKIRTAGRPPSKVYRVGSVSKKSI